MTCRGSLRVRSRAPPNVDQPGTTGNVIAGAVERTTPGLAGPFRGCFRGGNLALDVVAERAFLSLVERFQERAGGAAAEAGGRGRV